MKRIQRAALASCVALCVGLACASARIKSEERYAEDERLPRPGVLLVYDFAVTPNDVVVDTLGSEFAGSTSPSSEDVKRARQVAASLSTQLVSKLLARGINAARATRARVPPVNAMVLKGEFISIDEGSRVKRMVIGFGAGSSELRVRAHVYQATPHGLRRIARAEAKATGSRTPGMAVPVGVGAAAGRVATSAVVSGGMNVAREVRGGMDADAGRLADEIAKRAEAFYKGQGWL
jgi:hypothetical protein